MMINEHQFFCCQNFMLYGRGMHMHVQSLLTQHGCMVMGAICCLLVSQCS